MPRTWQRKTQNGQQTSAETMEKALTLIMNDGISIRETSKTLNIPKSTLHRYLSNAKAKGRENIRLSPNYGHKKVFSTDDEKALTEYLMSASRLCYGLSSMCVRKLAYEYAKRNQRTTPNTWETNMIAGIEWMIGFMQRNKQLSLRISEANAAKRAGNFEMKFYSNLKQVMETYHFEPSNIYNEKTFHVPSKVVFDKKLKHAGDRGGLVTLVGAVNAAGNSIPPYFIFPEVTFKPNMLQGAPPGSNGAASRSGSLTSEVSDKWLDHFLLHSKASRSNPTLLILGNHQSHVSIPLLEKAQQNGITLLTIPPQPSQKLQSLDHCVYRPLQKFYTAACGSWLTSNPGQRITIYEVAELAGQACVRAYTPQNIISGFRSAGIFPLDSCGFPDFQTEEPSSPVTEPTISGITSTSAIPSSTATAQSDIPTTPPMPPACDGQDIQSQTSDIVSPLQRRARKRKFEDPHVKIGKKKSAMQVKPKILTKIDANVDQPVKDRIAKLSFYGESTEVADGLERLGQDPPTNILEKNENDLAKGIYVLVGYKNKKGKNQFFVGVIESATDGICEVSFMKRMATKVGRMHSFLFPDEKDTDFITSEDVIQRLPSPVPLGQSSRSSNVFQFHGVDFSRFFR